MGENWKDEKLCEFKTLRPHIAQKTLTSAEEHLLLHITSAEERREIFLGKISAKLKTKCRHFGAMK